MHATKRKFNAILNGMGNKSTTSLPQKEPNDDLPPASTDSQVKKRRMIPSRTGLATSAHPVLTETVKAHKKSASTATGLPPSESPKYAPWDRVAFLQRLKSFSNLTDWTAKPAKVNEVEWAKRGWVCQKSERVRCCLCNSEILVKLNRKEVDGVEEPVYIAGNIEDALVERYVDLIVTSHDEDCLWRKRGCDDSIFKLPLNNTEVALSGLRDRYDELCVRKDTLPYTFNLQLPQQFNLDRVLGYLPPNYFQEKTTPTIPLEALSKDINKVAFQMALFGWQGHAHERLGDQLGSVSCQACFRVLGLWLFKSKAVNAAGEEMEGAKLNGLDLINEHRIYCPWRNAESQNGQSTKSTLAPVPGWEVLLRVLKNDHYLRHAGDRPLRKVPVELESTFGDDDENEDARSIREEKDKERWARLRRVKSLFDTKGVKRPNVSSKESKGKSGV